MNIKRKTLLNELKDILKEHNLSLKDIKWVGTRKNRIKKKQFLSLSDFKYNSSTKTLCSNLIIVGNDWWIEKIEPEYYDHWDAYLEFRKFPRKPKSIISVKKLYGDFDLEKNKT